MRFPKECAWALALVVALAVPSAEAGTWKVGRTSTDCPGGCHFFDALNVGEGIDLAMRSQSVSAGDTVMVFPGKYLVRFEVKSGVVLTTAGGPDSTVICGNAGGIPGVSMINCSPSTVVEGFTIRWDSGDFGLGGAIGCFSSSGTIRNNVLRGCRSGIGASIYQSGSDVRVSNNLFLDNQCLAGAGVIALSGSAPMIDGNTFYGCEAPFGTQGAALFASGSQYTFRQNIVMASVGAPGVFCGGTNTTVVECNLFWDNDFGPYGGNCVDSTGTSGNIVADPLFCDTSQSPMSLGCTTIAGDVNVGDFSYGMCVDSPALSESSGEMGYSSPLGSCPGCFVTASSANVAPSSWGNVKARYRSTESP